MRFSCSQCDTRYRISEQRVANKRLKVRCKTCGAVIVVTGHRSSSDASNSSVAPRVTAWFVAVDGARRGPLGLEDLQALREQGLITDESYVWCEGMARWTPLNQVSPLRTALLRLHGDQSTEPARLAATPWSEALADATRDEAAETLPADTQPEFAVIRASDEESSSGTRAPEPSSLNPTDTATRMRRPPQESNRSDEHAAAGAKPASKPEAPTTAHLDMAITGSSATQEPPSSLEHDHNAASTAPTEGQELTACSEPDTPPERHPDELPTSKRADTVEQTSAEPAPFDELEAGFFEAVPQLSTEQNLFADFDARQRPTADDKAFLAAQMRQGVETQSKQAGRDAKLSAKEKAQLRQEFSVVTTLEQSSRRRSWGLIVALVCLAAGVATAIVVSDDETVQHRVITKQPDMDMEPTRVYYAVKKPKATGQGTTKTKASPPSSNASESVALNAEVDATSIAVPKKERAKSKTRRKARSKASTRRDKASTDKAAWEAVARDPKNNKREKRIGGSLGDANRRAADEEKDRAMAAAAAERGSDIKRVMKQKRRQFNRCQSAPEDKVRLKFTVTSTGRVSQLQISGTGNQKKHDCVKQILMRAQFPAGDTNQPVSQVLTL